MPITQPKWGWTDQQFIDEAFTYIKRINPAIDDGDLIDAKVGRLRHAQPICEPNFRDKPPPVQTPIEGPDCRHVLLLSGRSGRCGKCSIGTTDG
jgi:hypothetical protein